MESVSIFVAFMLLLVNGEDKMSIRFAPQSVIPTNEDFLKDNSSETCATFGGGDNEPGLQHTQLRIRSFPIDVGDINITITGSNLGCGHNLYVSPLSPVKSEQWIGRWTACELEDKTTYGEKEVCSYWCKSPGHCKETQILKVPKNNKESRWEICQITISANTTGELVNLAMLPGTKCTQSSKYQSYSCYCAMDGSVDALEANEWVSGTYYLGEWVQVKFPSLVAVYRLEIWHKCKLSAQARILELAFSYGTTFLADGLCDGSNSHTTCIGQRFTLHNFHPEVVTEWVKVTEIEYCTTDDPAYFGLQEVKAFGKFMGK